MTEVCFVLAAGQNNFFFELAEVFRAELEGLGLETSLSTDGFPEADPERVYALIPPHEYFVLEGHATPPPPGALERTLFISAEQPATVHFGQNCELARSAGAVFDINARAVRAYRRRGIRAEHVALGYTPVWDRFEGAAERATDVIFMGADTPRRERILAGMATELAATESRLILSDNSRPNPAASTSFLAGDWKWDALRDSRILLNIHQGREPYFEWHRVIQAIHCGTVVLTENSTDHAPLVAGTDFVAASVTGMAEALTGLLADGERRETVARTAFETLRGKLAMSETCVPLAEAAERLRSGDASRPRIWSRALAPLFGVGAKVAARRSSGEEQRAPAAPVSPGDGSGPLLVARANERSDGASVVYFAAAELPDATSVDALESSGPVLLVGPGQTLLPNAARHLSAALERDPEAEYAYGLLAAGGRVENPFGWEQGRDVSAPILLRSGGKARDLDTLIAGLGDKRGVNAHEFIATAAEGSQPPSD